MLVNMRCYQLKTIDNYLYISYREISQPSIEAENFDYNIPPEYCELKFAFLSTLVQTNFDNFLLYQRVASPFG